MHMRIVTNVRCPPREEEAVPGAAPQEEEPMVSYERGGYRGGGSRHSGLRP